MRLAKPVGHVFQATIEQTALPARGNVGQRLAVWLCVPTLPPVNLPQTFKGTLTIPLVSSSN